MKLKTFLILFFVLILSSLTSSQLTEIGDKEKPKPIEIFEPVISSRTATTDTYYMGGNEFKTTYYAGAVNAKLNNNTYIPFEDYVNVSNENGKVKFENIYGEICYLEPEYELTNLFSTAKTEVNIVKNRGSYYFTTDAKDDVNSMSYKINCSPFYTEKETKEELTNDNIKFIDNELHILNDVKIDFGMAKDLQNITTVYNETTSKLDFAIEEGKSGSLKLIDPTITYDFNNHTGQSAYKCEGYYYSYSIAENPVDLPPDCTIISSYSSWHDITTETTIDEIDESREDIYVAVVRTNNFFYTNFTIPSEWEVTKYEWFLTSNVGTPTNADVRYLVYNYTSSLWVLIKTVNQDSGDSTEDITLTEGDYDLADFTDENGKINFIALSLRGGDQYHFYINYVKLDVTYTSDFKLNFTSPNTTNPSTVSEGQKLVINFTFDNGEPPITSGVTLNNFLVGGLTATIDQGCSGTLVCSGYSTETECNNCSECNWDSFSYFLTDLESFETDLGDYTTSGSTGCVWARDTNGVPSDDTGPTPQGSADGANSTPYYAFIETSSSACDGATDQVYLTGPVIDLDTYPTTMLSFSYSMYGANMGKLDVEINNSGDWVSVWSLAGNQGADPVWTGVDIDLSIYSGSGNVRFHYDRNGDGAFEGDIAIDHINISQKEFVGCSNTGDCSSCSLDECNTNCSTGGCSICSGTLVCSGYSTETECNNCSQCNWTTIVEITVVSNTSANSLAKTVTIDKPSDVQDDDVLFVYLFHDNNDAGDEFATLSGWTQIFSLTDDPSGRGGTTWLGYKVITDASGEPADYTFTHTDSVDEETGAIMVNLRGVDTDDPLANSTGYTYLFQANTGDFLTPSITTDSDNALVLTMGSMSHTMTYANAPSGTNKIVYMDDDYDNLMMASYTQESAGATGDKQWDTDGTQEARGEQVAFKLGTASSCSAIDSGDCSSCSLDECNTNCSTGGCSSENDISYVGDYWQFNATMPYGLSGSQDIFLNISYGESNYNQTEPDAITYTGGAADPCDYISGDYIINLEDNCTKTGVNIDVTGDFKVYGYYGYFLLDQYTNLTVAGNMAFNFTDSNIVLRDGSKLS